MKSGFTMARAGKAFLAVLLAFALCLGISSAWIEIANADDMDQPEQTDAGGASADDADQPGASEDPGQGGEAADPDPAAGPESPQGPAEGPADSADPADSPSADDPEPADAAADRELRATLYTDDTLSVVDDLNEDVIVLKGALPEDAHLVAYPIDPTDAVQELLQNKLVSAYNVLLFAADGTRLELTDDATAKLDLSLAAVHDMDADNARAYRVDVEAEETQLLETQVRIEEDETATLVANVSKTGIVAVVDSTLDQDGNPIGKKKAPRKASKGSAMATVDTASKGIVLNLFDYALNDTTSNNGYGSPDRDGGHINAGLTSEESQLHFYGYGTQGSSINNYAGTKGDYKDEYAMQGIVRSNLSGSDGDDPSTRFPVLNTNATYHQNLSYLFSTTESAAGKTVYSGVNGLFYEEGGYLVYDSNYHYAELQDDGKTFKVYDSTYNRKKSNQGDPDYRVGFFPFDKWWTGSNEPNINPWNGKTDVNHHFGMTLTATFTMPYQGDIDGNPMVFEFSGDDDMWVFIDGKLVMDVGGIHQPVKGTINFDTGNVTIGAATGTATASGVLKASGIVDTNQPTMGTTTNLWTSLGLQDAWRAGTEHTIQCFYLERGGCDSNLMLKTNLYIPTTQDVSAAKQWQGVDEHEYADKTVNVKLVRKAVGRDKTFEKIDVVSEAALSKDGWSHTWTGLPTEGYYSEDSSNADYDTYCDFTYYVVEDAVDGYQTSYLSGETELSPVQNQDAGKGMTGTIGVEAGGSVVTIVNKPITTSVDVQKAWSGTEPASGSVWFQLLGSDGSKAYKELKPGAWSATFADLPVKAGLTYTVSEGTYDGTTFTPYSGAFTLGDATYKQTSIEYQDKDGAAISGSNPAIDGSVYPKAGKVVITNAEVKASLSVKKVDAADETKTLPGAKFVLKDSASGKYLGAGGTWVDSKDSAQQFTADGNGVAAFGVLKPGDYEIYETFAPAGYQLMDENAPVKVSVSEDGVISVVSNAAGGGSTSAEAPYDEASQAYMVSIGNTKLPTLPTTGASGGLALSLASMASAALGTGLLLGARRRRDK